MLTFSNMINMSTNKIDSHKLSYELTEVKPVKTATKSTKVVSKRQPNKVTKSSFSDKIKVLISKGSEKFHSVVNKVLHPNKKTKKLTKNEREMIKNARKNVILGIGLLLTVVSIAYSTYMTNLFVDGVFMIVALAPQVIFAAIILIKAFSKIYK